MKSTDLEKHFDFHSQPWAILKQFLVAEEQNKIGQLLGTDDPNKSNELRGQIKYIRSLLAIETAALNSR